MSDDSGAERRSFNESIWAILEQIPSGRVCSYSLVADLAGFPGRARHVASALRAAPATLHLPWHRVVTASGHLGLKPGCDGHQQQVDRLRKEGVTVWKGRVDLQKCGWGGNLDALLWAETDAE